MSLLSGNLLNTAARLIGLQLVSWRQWTGNVTNDAGQVVPTYAAPVTLSASVQPVPRLLYERYGLDFQKDYRMVYCAQPLQDLQRGASCDTIDYDGYRFNVQSNTDWQSANGWQGSLCIAVGPAS